MLAVLAATLALLPPIRGQASADARELGLPGSVVAAEGACEQGSGEACLDAGNRYAKGRGTEKDIDRGALLCQQGCNLGVAEACGEFGMLLLGRSIAGASLARAAAALAILPILWVPYVIPGRTLMEMFRVGEHGVRREPSARVPPTEAP